MTHDVINTGDKIWFVTDNERYIGNVLNVLQAGNAYTIAVYKNDTWEIITASYSEIFPRIRYDKIPDIFEIFDVVLVRTSDTKSLGIVVGMELGLYVVQRYANEIWHRIVVATKDLEHHEGNYDETLFENRKKLFSMSWVKWNLP